MAQAAPGSVKKVPQGMLGVSEPDPRMFGNARNERTNPSWSNQNWLKSRFHFSFAEYHNSANTNFGVLRVMNDDLVQPKRGFGEHSHRDAEICTYVVKGELTHKDSMGTAETLSDGAIQFMTAGRGVRHSEHNLSGKPLRFIQMWLTPRRRGLPSNYGSDRGDKRKRLAGWHHVVSDVENKQVKAAVQINADANMFVTELAAGASRTLSIAEGRQAYLLCIDGSPRIHDAGGDGASCGVEGVSLDRHDAAELKGPLDLSISGASHLLVVEMKHAPGSDGRRDL